jgi:O-antigen/teichoic acid export membrane protein
MATYAGQLELGVSQAGVYLAGQRTYSLQDVTGNNLVVIPTIGLFWLTGCLVAAVFEPEFMPADVTRWYLIAIGAGGFCLLLISMSKDLVIASGSVGAYSLIDFSEPLLRSLLIGGGVLLFGFGLGGVLASWLAALLVTAVTALWLIGRRLLLLPRFRLDISRRQLSFGLRNSAGYLLQGLNSRVDVFFVAYFVGHTALGYYAVAFSVAELLWQIPFAFAIMLFPKASALDGREAASTASATCRQVLLVTFVAVAGALVTGHFLLSLYGEEFLKGLTAYYILAPSALCYCVYKVLGSALAARGRPETTLYSGLVSLPVTLALDFYLIPRWGIEGAAVASLTAYTVNALAILWLFLRTTGQGIVETLVIQPEDLESSLSRWRLIRGSIEARFAR